MVGPQYLLDEGVDGRMDERKEGERVGEICFEKGFHEEGIHFAGTCLLYLKCLSSYFGFHSTSHRILAIYDLENV